MVTSPAKDFRHLPSIKVETLGYGAGLEDSKIPYLKNFSRGENKRKKLSFFWGAKEK